MSDSFNAMRKQVISSTLRNPTWNNTHVIGGDAVEKKRVQGDAVFGRKIRIDAVEGGAVFGAEVRGRLHAGEQRRQMRRPRLFEAHGIGAVGNHDDDLGREILRRRLDQRGHVRSAAGDQDSDAALHNSHHDRSRWPL